MTKLEKLKKESQRVSEEIEKMKCRKIELENKIEIEELEHFKKMLKEKNLSYEDIEKMLSSTNLDE